MASSEKRNAANRENARRSTGPSTVEGKDRARRNGITHGLTTTAMLLDDEDPEIYNALVEATLADLGPRSDHERALALNVANTLWRRDRLYGAEVAFTNIRTRALRAEHPELRSDAEARAMMLLDAEDANRARLLARYLNSAERACHNAVDAYWSARNAALESELDELRLCEAISEYRNNAAAAEIERLGVEAEAMRELAVSRPPAPAIPEPTLAATTAGAPFAAARTSNNRPEHAPLQPPKGLIDPTGLLTRLIAEGKLEPFIEEELQ